MFLLPSAEFADLAKIHMKGHALFMAAETINISLTEAQKAWVMSRKEQGGFASASDVFRELIRREQEREWETLGREFDALSKDGGIGQEPVEEINRIVGQVKRERREAVRRA
jgi:Arc/MetJ-type ribon-helix-helix transcriptional regulator